MRRALGRARGSSLLGVMVLTAILFGVVVGVLVYTGQERRRAVQAVRNTSREDCVQAGLQLARSFFGRNFSNWNNYLGNPTKYNPIPNSRFSPSFVPMNPLDLNTQTTLRATDPQLFADLDGDGKMDVYIYIRDNEDEFPPAVQNFGRDNDQTVIAGAFCISQTMAPRYDNNTTGLNQATGLPDPLIVEGLLSYNQTASIYRSQSAAGATGTGNQN